MAARGLWLRLGLTLALAVVLGYLVVRTPGMKSFAFDGGSLTVPASLEGWDLQPGQGATLLAGGTRLGIINLELARTDVAVSGGDLPGYIAARHDRFWKERENYQPRLKGELRKFALSAAVPTGRAVYPDRFLLWDVTYVLHEVYLAQKGSYLRLSLRYPEFLTPYVGMDEIILAANIKTTP